MTVYIENETEVKIDNDLKNIVVKVAEQTLKNESLNSDFEVDVLFVEPDAIQTLNNEHRGIDQVTDVLSFPMQERQMFGNPEILVEIASEGGEILLGDIVICYQRAVEQAAEYGHSIEREIGFLTAHSMLHLLGYDHVDEEDELEMMQKQEEILRDIGLRRD